MYVCAGYVKKATLQVIHLRYGFWYRIFLGATGMMVHLDVLKFTPSPKKRKLGERHIWQRAGNGHCWDMLYGNGIWTDRHTSARKDWWCVFLFGWTINSLVKLILLFCSLMFGLSCCPWGVFFLLLFLWETWERKNKNVYFCVCNLCKFSFIPFSVFFGLSSFLCLMIVLIAICDLILWEIIPVLPWTHFPWV